MEANESELMDWVRMQQQQSMKVSLPVVRDSDNSYPKDQLVFEIGDEMVTIYLDDLKARQISVSRDLFEKLLIMVVNNK